MSWTFKLDYVTPSLNEIRSQHWAAQTRGKTALGWILVSSLNQRPAIPLATGKRRVTITRHGKGQLDRDNLFGGAKDLVDAIKARRLILDDNPDACELIVKQVVDRKATPHTVVTIEDLPLALEQG